MSVVVHHAEGVYGAEAREMSTKGACTYPQNVIVGCSSIEIKRVPVDHVRLAGRRLCEREKVKNVLV